MERKRINYSWDENCITQARREGWCLSERDDGLLEIQRDDVAGAFRCDADAARFLMHRAKHPGHGGVVARLAIELNGTRWYEEVPEIDVTQLSREQVQEALSNGGCGDQIDNAMFVNMTETSGAHYIVAYDDDTVPSGVGLGHVYVKLVDGKLWGEF